MGAVEFFFFFFFKFTLQINIQGFDLVHVNNHACHRCDSRRQYAIESALLRCRGGWCIMASVICTSTKKMPRRLRQQIECHAFAFCARSGNTWQKQRRKEILPVLVSDRKLLFSHPGSRTRYEEYGNNSSPQSFLHRISGHHYGSAQTDHFTDERSSFIY